MLDNQIENEDSHVYSGVAYYRETVEFICKALSHYVQQLTEEINAIELDPVLGELLGGDLKQDSEITREIDYISQCKEYFEASLDDDQSLISLGSLSHGLVRKLKSIALKYLEYLKNHRDEFSSRSRVSNISLKAIDARLISAERSLSSGVFGNATPLPLLVDDFLIPVNEKNTNSVESSVEINESTIPKTASRRPLVLPTIGINDTELRRRCLDLVIRFQDDGDEDRLDSVVREATVVLESRLRDVLQDSTGTPVLRLIDLAFGNESRILISTVTAEQQGVHALFRGVIGFVRNRHHHKISAELKVMEVLQIIGFIDYLLALLEGHALGNES